jgi:hypothetical protein
MNIDPITNRACGGRRAVDVHDFWGNGPATSNHALSINMTPCLPGSMSSLLSQMVGCHVGDEDRRMGVETNLARIVQVLLPKLVLEVMGSAGAVWGFSEVVGLRTESTVWFWRPAALFTGLVFFHNFVAQVQKAFRTHRLSLRPGDRSPDGLPIAIIHCEDDSTSEKENEDAGIPPIHWTAEETEETKLLRLRRSLWPGDWRPDDGLSANKATLEQSLLKYHKLHCAEWANEDASRPGQRCSTMSVRDWADEDKSTERNDSLVLLRQSLCPGDWSPSVGYPISSASIETEPGCTTDGRKMVQQRHRN